MFGATPTNNSRLVLAELIVLLLSHTIYSSKLGPKSDSKTSNKTGYNRFSMAVEILFPELGESVHEGQVSKWLKNIGDHVKEDEPVVEIMTDKVNTELPAPATGILVAITAQEGDEVEVFSAMGIIEEDEAKAKEMIANGAVAAPAPKEAPADNEEAPAATEEVELEVVTADGERKWYTPVVKAMAKEAGVTAAELAGISGSGQGGRVTKKDLEAYIANPSAKPKKKPVVASGPEVEVQKLVGMRKMIADHMTKSSQIPVVSTLTEVDVTNIVNYRAAHKESFQKKHNTKLTFTPFFIQALCETLLEYPYVNSALEGTEITVNRAVHMGIAVSLGEDGSGGLIVPVIKDCHKMGLAEIAHALTEIAGKARNNSLQTEDVQGATFTLTNPGSYGATLGTPMISAPQAGILGTYGIVKRPVVINDMIAIRSMMNLVLTYDHRLVDGMTAGRFLQALKARLEEADFSY